MKKLFNKNRKGFSLTEVLVAVLVLTMAVVSASNFLVSMMRSNSMNTSVLQSYYYSVEGLEAFRNMRDTYFMNYLSFCGDGDGGESGNDIIFGKGGFCEEGEYVVDLADDCLGHWGIEMVNSDNTDVGLIKNGCGTDLSSGIDDPSEKVVASKTFNRICEVQKVEDEDGEADDDDDQRQITCKTTYTDGSKTGDIALSMILTNWKQ